MVKRGRPVQGAARNNVLQVRFTDAEIAILREKSEYIGVSQADILREGMLYGIQSLENKMSLERKIELAELEDPELCGYYDELCEEDDNV